MPSRVKTSLFSLFLSLLLLCDQACSQTLCPASPVPAQKQTEAEQAAVGNSAAIREGLSPVPTALPIAPAKNKRKLVLVLGGGGARGAAHIGVLRELDRHDIKVDAVVGTSIGAIVGGLYSAGLSPDKIEHILLGRAFLRSYLTVPIAVRLLVAPILLLPRLIGFHPYDGLYRGNRFANFVNSAIPGPPRNIEELPITYAAVCSDLVSAQPYMVQRGKIGRAIQASAAIPALRKPVADDPEKPNLNAHKIRVGSDPALKKRLVLLVDGGIQANLPVSLARRLAEKLPLSSDEPKPIILAVNVDESFDPQTISADDFRKIGSVGQRVASMLLVQGDQPEINLADLTIQPDTNGITLLSTKTADARRAIARGEEAARQAIPKLQELLSR